MEVIAAAMLICVAVGFLAGWIACWTAGMFSQGTSVVGEADPAEVWDWPAAPYDQENDEAA